MNALGDPCLLERKPLGRGGSRRLARGFFYVRWGMEIGLVRAKKK